jgi:hypothetical protein
MTKINCTVNVQVTDGPKFSLTNSTEVEAYDKIDVTVPKNTPDTKVQIQPGGAGQSMFLLITADKYADTLTYSVNVAVGAGGAGAPPAYTLDGPHLLMGKGGVALLDDAPTDLFFSNGDATNDAKVHILVGRDATP